LTVQFFIYQVPSTTTVRKGFQQTMDQTLTCRDCGQEFIFTAGEQAFYAEREYTPPQRCPSCRAARKSQRNSGGGYGADNYGGGGYSSGGGRSSGGGYSNRPREMHAATCSNCGKETEVPFVPTSGKPVYCRECFQDRRDSGSGYSRY
jgi:CxxC-x17-CxxC domain-containing protein